MTKTCEIIDESYDAYLQCICDYFYFISDAGRVFVPTNGNTMPSN